MKFKNLFIRGFGAFDENLPPEDRFFRFEPQGMNIILGQNERGKTTLMEALIDTLFGIPHIRRNLRKPWGEYKDFAVDLEFEINNRSYRVERNFDTHVTKLVDLDEKTVIFNGNANPRGRSRSAREFRKIIADMGIPSRDIIEELAFVKKMEMETGISDEIRRLITGGGTNYLSIADALKKEYFQLTRFDPWQSQNKNSFREIEDLYYKLEILKTKESESRREHRDVLEMEQEIIDLEKEIKEHEEALEKAKFIRKNLGESIQISNEQWVKNETLASLIEERSRIISKKEESKKLRFNIEERFEIFEKFEGDVINLCRSLAKIRDRLSEIEKRSEGRDLSTIEFEEEKKKLKEKLESEYPKFKDLEYNFPDEYEKYVSNKEELKADNSFLNERKLMMKNLEDNLSGLPSYEDRSDTFEDDLHRQKNYEYLAKTELERLNAKLKEARVLETSKEGARELIEKEYEGYSSLPTDVVEKINLFFLIRDDRKNKKKELEEMQDRLKEIDGIIKKPFRYGLLIGLMFISFVAGLILGDVVSALWSAVAALFAGGSVLGYRLKDHLFEKNKLEATVELLKHEISSPLPDTGVPEDMKDKLKEITEKYSGYRDAMHRLTKFEIEGEEFKPSLDIEKKIEEIESKVRRGREKIEVPIDADLNEIMVDCRAWKKLKNLISVERQIIKGRFPGLPDDFTDQTPPQIEELEKKLKDFEERFPFAAALPEPAEVKKAFGEMVVIRGEIQSLESKIQHIREYKIESEEAKKAEIEEEIILEKLAPLTTRFGDDPDNIEAKYRSFEDMKKQDENLKKMIEEFRDLREVNPQIANLSAQLMVLDHRRRDLVEKCPSIGQFTERNIGEADFEMKKLEEDAEEYSRLIADAREKKNLLTVRIEEKAKNLDDFHRMKEEIDEISERIERLEIMKEGYKKAVDVLQESVDEFQKTYRQTIEEDIDLIFKRIAGEKYSIRLDSSFEIFVKEENGIEIDRNALSTGTRDQLYFAVRIALAEGLSHKLSLPFLLDDPFVFFDGGRLGTAREILEEIGKDHQIIIFSHNPDYADWGKVVTNFDKRSRAENGK